MHQVKELAKFIKSEHYIQEYFSTYHVQFLKLGPGEGLREVLAIIEALNLDPGLMLGGQGSLGLLNLSPQFLDSSASD